MQKCSNWILALVSAFIAYLIAMSVVGPVLTNDCVVQDDFNQSFFWFWKFWDPSLLPDGFFQKIYMSNSVRTPLFLLIFKFAPLFTDNFIYFSKLLVIIIAAISGLFAYLFFEKLSNHKIAALGFATALSTVFWTTDHLSAACPRSFIWLGLLAYMYFKLSSKHITAAVTCFILLLLSPNTFLIVLTMEFIYAFLRDGMSFFSLKFNPAKPEFYSLVFNGLATIILYKLLFRDIQTQGFGKPFTVAEMQSLPEFNPGGRHPIFGSNIWDGSWWTNEHWGLGIGWLKISQIIPSVATAAAICFLVLALLNRSRIVDFLKQVFCSLPAQLFYASILLYILSQLTFPMLYMPSRYIGIPWLLVSVILVFLIPLALLQVSVERMILSKKLCYSISSVLILFVAFSFWNSAKQMYMPNWKVMNSQVKAFIEKLPKDSVIVAHPMLADVNSCDIIAKRNAFIDYERSMSYCHESQAEIRRRNLVALAIIYAPDKATLLKLMKDNGVTHILVQNYFYSNEYFASSRKYIEPYNAFISGFKGKPIYLAKVLDARKASYVILSREQLEAI